MSGNAGAVDFPEYLKNRQEDWFGNQSVHQVDTNLTELINVALDVGGNPYEGETAYDPASVLEDMDDRVGAIDGLGSGYGVETGMARYATAAKAVENVWTESQLDSKFSTIISAALSKVVSIREQARGAHTDVGQAIVALGQSTLTNLQNMMTGISSTIRSEFENILQSVLTMFSTAVDSEAVDNMVTKYELATRKNWDAQVTEFLARTGNVISPNNSAVVIGLAVLGRNRALELDEKRLEFASKAAPDGNQLLSAIVGLLNAEANGMTWYMQSYGNVYQQLVGAFGVAFQEYIGKYAAEKDMQSKWVGQYLQGLMARDAAKYQLLLQAASMGIEVNKVRLAAESDQAERDLVLDVNFAKWGFDVYQWSNPTLGALNGVQSVSKEMSVGQKLLGGMTAGAAVGMSVGGPLGAGIGAGVGGLLSAIS